MKIVVKTLKGDRFAIQVNPNDSVADVKKNIRSVIGASDYPAAEQTLIHKGKILKDETTMEANNIAEKSSILIMKRTPASTRSSTDRNSTQQNKDGVISQPLDTESSSRSKITPTNCSRNEPDQPPSKKKCGDESHSQACKTSSQISIENLPSDILLEIFDLVSKKKTENKHPHSLVCRNWLHLYHVHRFRRLLQNWVLIRNTSKHGVPLDAQGYKSITSVIIDNKCPQSPEILVRNEDLLIMANEFVDLQKLELLGCSLVTARGLIYLVKRCSSLVFLHLWGCKHFDDAAVMEVVRASPSLQHLRLSYSDVTLAGIEILRSLTTVSTEGCPLSEVLDSFLSSV